MASSCVICVIRNYTVYLTVMIIVKSCATYSSGPEMMRIELV